MKSRCTASSMSDPRAASTRKGLVVLIDVLEVDGRLLVGDDVVALAQHVKGLAVVGHCLTVDMSLLSCSAIESIFCAVSKLSNS